MRIDLHQHLWPPQLIRELRRRDAPPLLEGDGDQPMLRLRHEPDGALRLAAHDPAERLRVLDEVGIDRAVVSLSTPIGIEALPATEALPLLDAYHEGIAEVMAASGGRIGAWAATGLELPDAGASMLQPLLRDGFSGVSLASEALSTRAGVERCEPLLSMLEGAGRPLFVHPGPAPWTPPYAREEDMPGWWANLAVYPGLVNRAFFTWRAIGAQRHPRLRLVFAVAGGGAPLLEGRFRTFSGLRGEIDPNVFLDTASSQRLALEHLMATYGIEQVVYGTDIPVIDGGSVTQALEELGDPVVRAVTEKNPTRLFDLEEVAA
jgi:6-methylsalicylate decarboxylase